jgi:hypothetical protein
MPQSLTSLHRVKDKGYGLLQLRSRIRLPEPSLFEQVSQMQAGPHADRSINARLILHRASPEKKYYLPKLLLSPMYTPFLPQNGFISPKFEWSCMLLDCNGYTSHFVLASEQVDLDPASLSGCCQVSHSARTVLTCDGSTGVTTLLASGPRDHPYFLTATLAVRTTNTRHLLVCQYQLCTLQAACDLPATSTSWRSFRLR